MCQECARILIDGSAGGFGGSDEGSERPPAPEDEPLCCDTTNEANDAQHICNDVFLARHGCRCGSGETATLYFPSDNAFRCCECTDYRGKPAAAPTEEHDQAENTEARRRKEEKAKGWHRQLLCECRNGIGKLCWFCMNYVGQAEQLVWPQNTGDVKRRL